MKPSLVLQTYDADYAAGYNATHLESGWTIASVHFQLDLLAKHLTEARNWLDVACGTGYVLSQFPTVERTGLDLSEAMLAKARQANPGVEFARRNFRDPYPEWNDRFQVVSCMWWAYCLAESVEEVRQLVARLAEWTAPDGTVILPLCNVNKFDLHNIKVPYIDPRVAGRCMITGVIWAWIEESGKRHDDVITPQVEHMVAMFRQYFEDVRVVEADLDVVGEGWRVQDVLVASVKRREQGSGDLYPPADGWPAGQWEWRLGVNGRALAGMTYPELGNLSRMRVSIDLLDGTDPWQVQASKSGFHLQAGTRYEVTFRSRASAERSIHIGCSMAEAPWTGIGWYQELPIGTEWQEHRLAFVATADVGPARIHLDVGTATGSVEVESLQIKEVP